VKGRGNIEYIAGLFALQASLQYPVIKSKQAAFPMVHNGIVASAATATPRDTSRAGTPANPHTCWPGATAESLRILFETAAALELRNFVLRHGVSHAEWLHAGVRGGLEENPLVVSLV
jgi:hypothetical protein